MPTEPNPAAEGETLDAALGGAVQLVQPRRGYRFSIDALLLADFASPATGRVLDLGTGCGVVLLALAHRSPGLTEGVGVEVQPDLAALARRNVELNRQGSRLRVCEGDWRSLPALRLGTFNRVVSNPPYRPVEGSRVSPTSSRAIARHEVKGGLEDLVGSARSALAAGSLCVVYPAVREARLGEALAAVGLHPIRLRRVHPHQGDPAELVLMEACAAACASPEMMPRLVLHEADGQPTPESRRISGAAL